MIAPGRNACGGCWTRRRRAVRCVPFGQSRRKGKRMTEGFVECELAGKLCHDSGRDNPCYGRDCILPSNAERCAQEEECAACQVPLLVKAVRAAVGVPWIPHTEDTDMAWRESNNACRDALAAIISLPGGG